MLELAEAAGAGALSAKVVNLASWSDANPSGLELHEPEPTDVVIMLGSSTDPDIALDDRGPDALAA